MFQEPLEITIDVVDPEGMPVTVSLVNGSPNKALIVDNVLIWNATNDASSHFYLKATDACQATSYINITVSLVVCQCQNNGSCVPTGPGVQVTMNATVYLDLPEKIVILILMTVNLIHVFEV